MKHKHNHQEFTVYGRRGNTVTILLNSVAKILVNIKKGENNTVTVSTMTSILVMIGDYMLTFIMTSKLGCDDFIYTIVYSLMT